MPPTDPIQQIVHQLSRLPGIGRKSATRLAYFILRQPDDYASRLADALLAARRDIRPCGICGNLTGRDPCRICADESRDRFTLCVVEHVPDLLAVEATGEYRGLYHVLEGAISPLSGIGPEDLRIAALMTRLETEAIEELIVATNPTVDGEATALYIKKLAAPSGVKLSRIASGMPVGSDLEYLDRETITRALAGRREM